MKFIEATTINENQVLICLDYIAYVEKSSWNKDITDGYYEPLDKKWHKVPQRIVQDCTMIQFMSGHILNIKTDYEVIKALLVKGEEE